MSVDYEVVNLEVCSTMSKLWSSIYSWSPLSSHSRHSSSLLFRRPQLKSEICLSYLLFWDVVVAFFVVDVVIFKKKNLLPVRGTRMGCARTYAYAPGDGRLYFFSFFFQRSILVKFLNGSHAVLKSCPNILRLSLPSW